MKVLIDNRVYDPNETPIFLLIENQDRENIANMHETCTVYACLPGTVSHTEAERLTEQAQLKLNG